MPYIILAHAAAAGSPRTDNADTSSFAVPLLCLVVLARAMTFKNGIPQLVGFENDTHHPDLYFDDLQCYSMLMAKTTSLCAQTTCNASGIPPFAGYKQDCESMTFEVQVFTFVDAYFGVFWGFFLLLILTAGCFGVGFSKFHLSRLYPWPFWLPLTTSNDMLATSSALLAIPCPRLRARDRPEPCLRRERTSQTRSLAI